MNKEWWLLGCWDRGRSGGPSHGCSTAPCTGTCTQTITLPIIIDGKRHYIPGPRCVLGSKLSGTGLHSGGKSLMEVGWVIRIRSNSWKWVSIKARSLFCAKVCKLGKGLVCCNPPFQSPHLLNQVQSPSKLATTLRMALIGCCNVLQCYILLSG